MLHVFTFKEGLLSRLAHDLRLSLAHCVVELEHQQLRVECDLSALRVDGAVVREQLSTSTLSESDKAKITHSMQTQVLEIDRHPKAQLQATLREAAGARFSVVGELDLHGRRLPLSFELALGERITGAFELSPSRWGIAPFRALGGALKIQDRVRVELDFPADLPGLDREAPLQSSVRLT